jgi:hypothetical protein
LHYGRARVVFAGDQFQPVGLAFDFVLDRVPHSRIIFGDEIGQEMLNMRRLRIYDGSCFGLPSMSPLFK